MRRGSRPARRAALLLFWLALGGPIGSGRGAEPAPPPADLPLSAPFAARSDWRLSATQGPAATDTPSGDEEPGPYALCLHRGGSTACDPALRNGIAAPAPGPYGDTYTAPHFIEAERVIRPDRTPAPLLLLVLGSVHSVDGDQLHLTELLAYRRNADRFARVYERVVGHNRNQEVRVEEHGRLSGDVLAAEPTDDAPFGYWVTVDAPRPEGSYRTVLRFRSATRYGDGNPLPVLDAEMPNILRRLGRWRPGAPLPLPADGSCSRPHLAAGALWCG